MPWSESAGNDRTKSAALTATALLVFLNLVSFADRYAVPSVLPLLKADLGYSDRALGTLSSAFFMMFMVASPAAGWLGDRLPRKPLIVLASLLMSASMLLLGFSHTYGSLVVHQTLLGLAEAMFAVIAPSIIADHFAIDHRSVVMTVYSLTIPVGTAAGMFLASVGGITANWRAPFFLMAAVGLGGTLIAALLLTVPLRGASEGVHVAQSPQSAASLLRNVPYLANVGDAVCLAFATVGTAVWIPTYLTRTMHLSLAHAGSAIGVATVIDGILGVLLGGYLARRCHGRLSGYYVLTGNSMMLALCTGVYALFGPQSTAVAAMLVTQVLLFLSTAPMALMILQAVEPHLRSTALALSLFAVHALGSAVAPTLVGWIADVRGLKAGLAAALLPLALGGVISWKGAHAADARSDANPAQT